MYWWCGSLPFAVLAAKRRMLLYPIINLLFLDTIVFFNYSGPLGDVILRAKGNLHELVEAIYSQHWQDVDAEESAVANNSIIILH